MSGLREELEREFNDIDTDKNGFLDEKEVARAIASCGYKVTPDEVKLIFQSMDQSGDGKVSKDEFVKAMEQAMDPRQHEQAMLRKAFQHYDKDGSGSIDKAELKLLFEDLGEKIPEERLNRVMELVDKDKSGTVELDEFVEAFSLA